MTARARLLVLLLAIGLGIPLACRSPREPKEQLSEDVQKEITSLQNEWLVIDKKVRDIERSRAFLEKRSSEELENIRRAIESIQNALKDMKTRLDALQGTQHPTSPVEPKRLPIEVSIALLVAIVLCLAIYLKLRSVRLREASESPPEETPGKTDTPSAKES